jgi:hypothetical protein
MGYSDYALKAYDPHTKTNMSIFTRFDWDEEKLDAYKDVLRMIGLRPGWTKGGYYDLWTRDLIDLIIDRRPDVRPFMAKFLRSIKRQNRNCRVRG